MQYNNNDLHSRLVHQVRGHATIYIRGRRLVSKDSSAFTDARIAQEFNADHKRSKLRLGGTLFAQDVLSEPLANRIGDIFIRLVPSRNFTFWFVAVAVAAFILGTASGSREPRDQSVNLSGIGMATYAFCLSMIVTWHEFGHMALARKLGIRIDSVGVGAYFVMPALFTNVSLIALLTPIERISVMLGGVYFQAILGTALAVWQLLVPNSVLPWLIQSNALIAALNLIPFIRLDGHHVANELIGILKRRGTHLRVRQAYVILNHAANGLFAIYLIYVWRASYFEALARPTAMAVVYFLFVTLVCTVLIYKNLKMLVGVLGRMGNRTN